MKFNQIKNAGAQFLPFCRPLPNNSLLLFVLLLPLIFVASCGGDASERAENVGGVTARQVIENPSAYVGKTVTVSGDVEEIHGPRAFNMDSGLSLGELLVIGREPFPQVPDRGNTAYVINDVATVTGVVRMLVTADVEREIGWDLDPRLEAEFNGKPVLIAQSVNFRSGANRSATTNTDNAYQTTTNINDNQSAAANVSNNQPAIGNEITDYSVLVNPQNPQSLVGKRVRLTNMKVQSVVGDRTFYVGPSESQRVFVVLDQVKTPNTATEGRYDINAGQTISINGIVEKMPDVQEARQRFGKLMSEAELNKLKDQQVLIHIDSIDNIEK